MNSASTKTVVSFQLPNSTSAYTEEVPGLNQNEAIQYVRDKRPGCIVWIDDCGNWESRLLKQRDTDYVERKQEESSY